MTSTHIGFPIETVLVFVGLSVGAILIDLFAHKDDKPISLKSAALWSLFWVVASLGFAGFLYIHHGAEVASLFITGYALEKVLSVDNLFVMMAIFSWFAIPDGLRHRVLYWGVIGAIIFRGIFVTIGTGLLMLGPWVELVFAAIVGWTAVMMLKNDENDNDIEDYSEHLAYRMVQKFFPVWPKLFGHNFFVKTVDAQKELAKAENRGIKLSKAGKYGLYATPLLLCLAVIEISDVMFAFDSVPAVIAVSQEPLIVYSAMMFAILGLRTLYFVLEALKQYLVHLEKSVVALLFFIAGKLALNSSDHFLHHGFNISATSSLIVVLVVLTTGILASVMFPEKAEINESKTN